ncbi:hypothetical protein [Kordia sp.]|uniref:hypothetical protein n=1 Tax=Kordia sp. TaxID=1965332 RepID=UPI003D6A44B6
MTKKSAGAIFIATVIIAIAGSLFYKNYIKQQQNNKRLKSFENLRSTIKKKTLGYETQQHNGEKVYDSFSEISKKEREAALKKIKEEIKKLEKQIN